VQYRREKLAEIYALYASEEVRGARPRFIEDVAAGERLPRMVKGPMTVTGFIAFAQGWGGLYIRANKLAWKQLQKHPGLGIPNRFGIPDVPERVHWEDELARLVGTPAAYDYGPERCSWMSHQLTNWIGGRRLFEAPPRRDPPAQSGRRYALHRGRGATNVRRERRSLCGNCTARRQSRWRAVGDGKRHGTSAVAPRGRWRAAIPEVSGRRSLVVDAPASSKLGKRSEIVGRRQDYDASKRVA
jgi:hypothetical protein